MSLIPNQFMSIFKEITGRRNREKQFVCTFIQIRNELVHEGQFCDKTKSPVPVEGDLWSITLKYFLDNLKSCFNEFDADHMIH